MNTDNFLAELRGMLQNYSDEQARALRLAEAQEAEKKFIQPPEGSVPVFFDDLWYRTPQGTYIRYDQSPAIATAAELGDMRPVKMKGR